MHQLHQLPLQAFPERLLAVSSHVCINCGPWASKASQPNSLLLYHTHGYACPELLNVVVQLDSLLLGVSTRLKAVKPHVNHLMQLELFYCARLCDAPDQPGAKVGYAQADHLPACYVQGAAVSASDISSSMANEARRRYEEAVSSGEQPPATPPTFSATDLESISGSFDTVVCLDVMIHYPQVYPHPPPCCPSPSATESRLSEHAAWKWERGSSLQHSSNAHPFPVHATLAVSSPRCDKADVICDIDMTEELGTPQRPHGWPTVCHCVPRFLAT